MTYKTLAPILVALGIAAASYGGNQRGGTAKKAPAVEKASVSKEAAQKDKQTQKTQGAAAAPQTQWRQEGDSTYCCAGDKSGGTGATCSNGSGSCAMEDKSGETKAAHKGHQRGGGGQKNGISAQGGGSHSTAGGASAAAAVTRFVCPMHPEVVSNKAGKCPKCGMALVAQTVKKEDAQTQPAQTMHCPAGGGHGGGGEGGGHGASGGGHSGNGH